MPRRVCVGRRQRGRGWRLGGEEESEESVSCVVSAWLDEIGIPSCRQARAHERLEVSGTVAVRVAAAGNGIWPEAHEGYIENITTKERREVRQENGVYVMDVQFDDETVDVITLDSGAGCNVWPEGRRAGKTSKLLPNKAGVGMFPANGTPIEYNGQRQVRFCGVRKNSSFHRSR